MEGAESVVWASWEKVLMRALRGSDMISRLPSSPTLNRRVAVSTLGPMPSPIKRMTFLASLAWAWDRPPRAANRAVHTRVLFMVFLTGMILTAWPQP